MILNQQNTALLSNLEKEYCKQFLLSNLPIIFPTDTVMGIGVNGFSKKAVDNLYKIKGRDLHKPLVLFVADVEDAVDFIEYPDLLKHPLILENWPGPLTAVFKKNSGCKLKYSLDPIIDTVGIRIPDSPFLRDLIRFLPFPLVTSSANRSYTDPCQNYSEAQNVFKKNVLIIERKNDKEAYKSIPSAVIAISNEGFKVLRKGKITGLNN